jgi:hypothetical protein
MIITELHRKYDTRRVNIKLMHEGEKPFVGVIFDCLIVP